MISYIQPGGDKTDEDRYKMEYDGITFIGSDDNLYHIKFAANSPGIEDGAITESDQIAVERLTWTEMEKNIDILPALEQIAEYAKDKNVFYFMIGGADYPVDFLMEHKGNWYMFQRGYGVKVMDSIEKMIMGPRSYSCYGVGRVEVSLLRSRAFADRNGVDTCILISDTIENLDQLMKYFVINEEKAYVDIDYRRLIETECKGNAAVICRDVSDGSYFFDLYMDQCMLEQEDVLHITDNMFIED